MLDFKELPSDGIQFEQLIRELFVKRGYETYWTGVGPDGGRDLIIVENLVGPMSQKERRWVISCKHNAHAGKAVGLRELGNIVGDCSSIRADGFILACSTYPSSSVITRLEDIAKNNRIITKIWDAVEIEKQLMYPETFGLIHSFFPTFSLSNPWRIYNAFSPAFWAANYKDYFFFLSSRNATTFPYLKSVEAIIRVLEKVELPKSKFDFQYLRPRCVYFNDKMSTHTVYVDYLFSDDSQKNEILLPSELQKQLFDAFLEYESNDMNNPDWDVRYVSLNYGSDNFEFDHKKFYEPYISHYERGTAREEFLKDKANTEQFYLKHSVKILSEEDVIKMPSAKRKDRKSSQ